MLKKITSFALASALAIGVVAPAPAMAAEDGEAPNPVEQSSQFAHSAQSVGLTFLAQPMNTLFGIAGMLSAWPLLLSSDKIPE